MAAVAAMSLGALAACGSSTSGDDAKGKVYYLNFKPEAADQWTALAKEYTKEKGVEVKVQTAASGTYEQTLKSEIAKTEAPTLFQVNGPVGYQNWKKYTADMSNTDVYKELANQDVALKDGDKVVGVPYVMETYGLIYNKVSTLINTDIEIGGQVTRTYSVGILEGDFTLMSQGKLKLSYLPDGAQLVAGDEVVTSGKGDVFPSGLVVGTVEAVFTDPSGMNRYAVVEPDVDLDSLVEVFVIKSFDIVE